MKKRKDKIRDHFQKEAVIFDERVVKVAPNYRDMIEALVAAIQFKKKKPIKIADLGGGTGTVTYLVKKKFPKAQVTCIDISQNMLDIACAKLKGMSNVEFVLADIENLKFNGKYDAIVSSLVLHHVEPGKNKAEVYRKIYGALKNGGLFVNADIIVSADKNIQQIYLNKWAEFILKSFSRKQLEHNHRRYKREDRPATLQNEINALKQAGFKKVEIFWKYYNFVTYSAQKNN